MKGRNPYRLYCLSLTDRKFKNTVIRMQALCAYDMHIY